MNELIIAFYKAYKAWLDAGSSYDNVFTCRYGLCGNFKRFITKPVPHSDVYAQMVLFDEHIGANENKFPFNLSGDDYFNESRDHACHRNPKRIAWVNEQVANI